MPIRGQLGPTGRAIPERVDRTWYVGTAAETNIAALDISDQFQNHGLSWLNRIWTAGFLLQAMRDAISGFGYVPLLNGPNGGKIGISAGGPDSPHRHRKTAELAAPIGDYALAAQHYERARWTTNRIRTEPYLCFPAAEDQKLVDLTAHYAGLAALA